MIFIDLCVLLCTEPPFSATLRPWSCVATARQCCANLREGVLVSQRGAPSEGKVTDSLLALFTYMNVEENVVTFGFLG